MGRSSSIYSAEQEKYQPKFFVFATAAAYRKFPNPYFFS